MTSSSTANSFWWQPNRRVDEVKNPWLSGLEIEPHYETLTERNQKDRNLSLPDITSNEMQNALYAFVFNETDLFKPNLFTNGALEVLEKSSNRVVIRKGCEFLKELENTLEQLPSFGIDPYALPPLISSNTEDGSALFEWNHRNFKIGFSIEPDPERSSWYIASNSSLNEISAMGYLPDRSDNKFLYRLLLWLSYFMILYSEY